MTFPGNFKHVIIMNNQFYFEPVLHRLLAIYSFVRKWLSELLLLVQTQAVV